MCGAVIIPDNTEFTISNELPADYRGYVLPGATIFSATGMAGQIFIQSIEQAGCCICYKTIALHQALQISFFQQASPLRSIMALKNSVKYKFKGLGWVNLEEGQFTINHSKDTKWLGIFEKGKIYHSLEINFSECFIADSLSYFPILGMYFKKKDQTKGFTIGRPRNRASQQLWDIVSQILRSPYDNSVSALLFQHKAAEYLLVSLVDAGKQTPDGPELSQEEWKKIDAIAACLRQEPDKKFPIYELASSYQLQPMKLKLAFKKKFHHGIFEYQMAVRMREALRLLQETDLNIKTIAGMVGYAKTTSFRQKFRDHFGYTPGKVERKQ